MTGRDMSGRSRAVTQAETRVRGGDEEAHSRGEDELREQMFTGSTRSWDSGGSIGCRRLHQQRESEERMETRGDRAT